MALDPSNSSNLKQLAFKGLISFVSCGRLFLCLSYVFEVYVVFCFLVFGCRYRCSPSPKWPVMLSIETRVFPTYSLTQWITHCHAVTIEVFWLLCLAAIILSLLVCWYELESCTGMGMTVLVRYCRGYGVEFYHKHCGNHGDGDSIHGCTAGAVTALTVKPR